MDFEKPNSGVGDISETLLRAAERHFEETLRALEELKERLSEGEDLRGSRISQISRDFRAATLTLLTERQKIESERKKVAGIVNDYALDLERARAEVRSRLDRIRDARGSE